MLNSRLLFVALVWGVNFSVVKAAIADLDPLAFTVIRFSLAALFLFAVMAWNGESFRLERKDRRPIVLLGFVGITLYNILFMYGLASTTASNSALLISLSPLCGSLIQALRGRERLGGRSATGLALATLGVALVITGRQGGPVFTVDGLRGDLLTLAATLTWAFYTIAARPLLARHSAVKVTAYAMLSGSLLLLPFGMPGLARQSWIGVPLSAWLALAFAAFIAAGIAYVFWYKGVQQIGVTRTMVYHYLMPFAAVVTASLFLGERMTLLQLAGGGAVLSGVFLVQQGTAHASEPHQDV
jgi:drug/metabolite transporter (DMT)-like permease